jgi:hypothetical protein
MAAFQPGDGASSAMRCIPDAIDASYGEELRAMLRSCVPGDVKDYFPCWATSYATGSRPGVDAQGCGPGMWLNAHLYRSDAEKIYTHIKDLLNRLRAHCARWSEVLKYQCTA